MDIIKQEGRLCPKYTNRNNNSSIPMIIKAGSGQCLSTLNQLLVSQFQDTFSVYMKINARYPETTIYAVECEGTEAVLLMISDFFKELEDILGKSPLVVREYPKVTCDVSTNIFRIYARIGAYE